MSNNQNAREFIRSCRQEYVPYPCKREEKFKDLLYSQFSGYLNEFSFIYGAINEKLNDKPLMGRLINSIEIDESSHERILSSNLKQLKQLIFSYVKVEDLEEGYYNQMYQWLEAFAALITSINTLVQEQLLSAVKPLNTSMSKLDTEYGKRVRNAFETWTQIELYMEGTVEFRDQFRLLSQHEMHNNDKTLVYSKIGYCLNKLVQNTDHLMVSLNEIGRKLACWRKLLDRIEKQENYN
ncbi:MAG TPA: hypothetical protein VEV87_06895 [Chitinophagaceae bacterium]|nr:hypothetical protein [Chitinophagaceae bacterium]